MANAKTISIVTSEGPPHTIDNHYHSGIDLDVTKTILSELGYRVEFKFVGLGRAERLIKSGQQDVMAPIFYARDSKNFYISNPIVNYKPMIFSLTKNNYQVSSLSDLQGHSIITFQGATKYFGSEFERLSMSENYTELADMSIIPEMLVKQRFDFAVLDLYIFYYFYRQHDKNRELSLFRLHPLIPTVPASAAFKDKALRDQFNAKLAEPQRAALYKKIVEKYLGNY